MTMPNFLYIGAPRAGSTWIFEALRAHPEVFVPIAKYIKYYTDAQYYRGRDWYEAHFDAAGPQHRAVGEVSIDYMYSDNALERIAADLPDIKLLACIRNPIERDWSAYLHMKRNVRVQGAFLDEVDGSYRFISEYGKYNKYLPKVFELFPKENVKIMIYDDLAADPHAFARDLYGFIGVDPTFEYVEVEKPKYVARQARNMTLARVTKDLANVARNAGLPNLIGHVKNFPGVQKMLYKPTAKASRESLSPEGRAHLIEKHRDGVQSLSTLLGRDLTHWTAPA